jgi:hypothetical protein
VTTQLASEQAEMIRYSRRYDLRQNKSKQTIECWSNVLNIRGRLASVLRCCLVKNDEV